MMSLGNRSGEIFMKTLMFFFILPTLLLPSCAANKKKRALAWEDWKGRSTSELKEHPYFKILPITKKTHDDGNETWLLRDQSRFQSDAYCQSLGGCIGLPTYNCDNIFSVKNDLILGFEQKGSCPGTKTIEAQKK